MSRKRSVIRLLLDTDDPIPEADPPIPNVPHAPLPVPRKVHNIPDEQLLRGFWQLEDVVQKIFEVRVGLGGRGPLMSFQEISAALRRQNQRLSPEEVSAIARAAEYNVRNAKPKGP